MHVGMMDRTVTVFCLQHSASFLLFWLIVLYVLIVNYIWLSDGLGSYMLVCQCGGPGLIPSQSKLNL
jgi:hypothetical protein